MPAQWPNLSKAWSRIRAFIGLGRTPATAEELLRLFSEIVDEYGDVKQTLLENNTYEDNFIAVHTVNPAMTIINRVDGPRTLKELQADCNELRSLVNGMKNASASRNGAFKIKKASKK